MPAWFLIQNDGTHHLVHIPETLLERAIDVDETGAVERLERTPSWEMEEWDTFPSCV
jgi:hypothetical protein